MGSIQDPERIEIKVDIFRLLPDTFVGELNKQPSGSSIRLPHPGTLGPGKANLVRSFQMVRLNITLS